MANLNSILADDYAAFDSDSATTSGRHALTLTNPDAGSTTCTNAVKRQSLENDVEQNNFNLNLVQCRWHVWKNDLANTAFVPQRDGYLTDSAGNKWYINSVSLLTAGTRYEIETMLQAGVVLR